MKEISLDQSSHVVSPTGSRSAPRRQVEWRVVTLPRDVSRAEARALLTEQAEYGRWELARTQVFIGGARRMWLKRRAIKVQRTDAA